MRKFRISDNGTIEIASESVFHDAIREIWGPTKEVESNPGEDSFLKFGYEVGTWIEGAGFGCIEVPHFVADEEFLEVDI